MSEYDQAIFDGDWVRCNRITDAVAMAIAESDVHSILEIGCGTGEQLISLARKFPKAQLTGIDISAPNVEKARTLVEHENCSNRIQVIQANYLECPLKNFDVIVSYSTLHLIPVGDEELFQKLAHELAPGGIFVNAIPYRCFFNSMLMLIRRIFRAFRGRMTDVFAMQLGKLFVRGRMDGEQLRSRLLYMYVLPQRMEGRAMRKMLNEKYGLKLERQQAEPHTSLAQPKHMLAVYRNAG